MTGLITPERGSLVLRSSGRVPVSGRFHVRTVLVCAALLLATAAVTFAALLLGAVVHTPAEVVRALAGDAPPSVELFVVQWRLPRALAAVVFGALLGVAGALFQSITRNPLGSPDIIGFTAGSSAGGVAVLAFVGSSYLLVAAGALTGGLVVAAIVLLLSRGGGVAGFRLVIVGIGLSAMLTSLETWVVLTADIEQAQIAALWGAGSLNAVSFGYTGPAMVIGLVALIVTGVLLDRRLTLLELGEDVSASLGSDPGRTRLAAVLAGVVLVAVVTAAAGPISFVALAAPHVGRRLAGATGVCLAPAACTGALMLASADLAAQHAIPGHSFPVGVATVAVGGLYLVTLLIRENRKGAL
ncbi:iron chelate uptake ABC transporter family permease subunit [Nocardiopsis sp. HNM0947]|uniref:Iron chelate uptake ABC transporter family permease subunit n=1 Tax=Nocardiopsis coralli TaxID=2772213 RepID=A0ABR9PAE4_9ACTN|nr:iron chelate uptake ABC transporter family permease subunit [Nocardiopsis coralli]MBE3000807.1 iron chelate uptake ABC transporter family permease subunit [Nocardiopsis coralli]